VHHLLLILLLALTSVDSATSEDLASTVSFPVEACDCVISYQEASELLDFFGDEQALGFALAITLGVHQNEIPMFHGRLKQFSVVQKLLRRGVFGVRVREDDSNDIEWVAWLSSGPQESRELIAALRPILQVNRMLVSSGISITECNGGLLLASEPPGALKQAALNSISDPFSGSSEPEDVTKAAPLVVSFRHADGLGVSHGETGVSRVSVSRTDGSVGINYQGWFEKETFSPPCCNRKLDVEIMERLGDDSIAVIVEHADTRFLPGFDLVEKLLPHMMQPERSDERWTRRLIVLGRSGEESDADVPAIAVAIEADGPGASSLRQDVSVLASLNSLRNRLGVKAGLQHLPRLSDLPEDGPRTVYARALMEPVFGGNPLSRHISINWCQAKGDSNWQLYATCPQLSASVQRALATPSSSLQCVRVAHAGQIHAENAARMVRSLIPIAHEFSSEDRVEPFRVGLALLFNFLWQSSEIQWGVEIPDTRTLVANVRIWPRKDPRP
jgi:hypothetical protein